MNKKAVSGKGCFWCCMPNKRTEKHDKKKEKKVVREERLKEEVVPEVNQPIQSEGNRIIELSLIAVIEESPKQIEEQNVEIAKESSVLVEIKSNVSAEKEASVMKSEHLEFNKVKGAITERVISNKIEVLNKINHNVSQYDIKAMKLITKDSLLDTNSLRITHQIDKENQEPVKDAVNKSSNEVLTPKCQTTEILLMEDESLRPDIMSPSRVQSSDEDGNIKPINIVRVAVLYIEL